LAREKGEWMRDKSKKDPAFERTLEYGAEFHPLNYLTNMFGIILKLKFYIKKTAIFKGGC
jgi:hypothetical protein